MEVEDLKLSCHNAEAIDLVVAVLGIPVCRIIEKVKEPTTWVL